LVKGISPASAQALQAAVPKKDSDGDNDGSKAKASSSAGFGPAVALSLTNVAKPDMAQGDPDHDGQ